MTSPLPVTIIGGYLGAGKTTLVNHLLRNANGVRLAVLVNEFGELAIDEDLIEAEDDDIISIAGGCVCCSFGSDLTGALMDMAKMTPPPDHLLIEASGVAIPSAIAGTVSLLDDYRMDGIIILADAETIEQSARDKYMGDTVLRQLADANIVVLNKTDLVADAKLTQTENWLDAQNRGVGLVRAIHGAVPSEILLDSYLAQTTQSRPHHEATNLEMMTLQTKHPRDIDAFAESLASEQAGLIRAKGFAPSVSGDVKLIQVVGNRWNVTDAPDDKALGIVCLGFKGAISKTYLKSIEDENAEAGI
ncbi:GTP-binding protein [Planktotalea sp.]|uniref:CobW family GTP-binding protein n=1 Tax=Planktotalea sp. TaxID=2029877 RepID=UPI003298642D